MLYLANDHAGFKFKQKIIKILQKKGIKFEDLGAFSIESVDYPKFGKLLAQKVAENDSNRGILICGSGIGMSIVANRNPKIRAGLCKNSKITKLARQHNNINVLVLAGRDSKPLCVRKMIDIFLNTPFLGGKYADRLNQID